MLARIAQALVSALALAALTSAQSYPRAGHSADLQTVDHQVDGRVTIVDADTLRVENFFYDGFGAQAFFRLGRATSEAAFASGLQLAPELARRPYRGETFLLDLPAGTNLDGYVAVSVWCVPFGFSMGFGTFEGPTCAPGSVSARNGSGLNAPGLAASSRPILGSPWTATLDCAGHAPGLGLLQGRPFASAGVSTAFGELLIAGPLLFQASGPHAGASRPFTLAIPADPALCGLALSTQGVCLGTPGPRLSNALDLVLGGS